MSFAARKLAKDLGLTGKHVFFNEKWVDYDDRANYLLDADIGVSCHLDHLETSFSFRTRMLDYLWAGLPMVATRGDVFSDLIETNELGLTVEAGDVDGLAAALARVFDDAEFAKNCKENLAALAPDYRWSQVLRPLVDFCRSPHRAPDLLDPWAIKRLAVSAATVYRPTTGWRRDVELAVEHYRAGGGAKLARKVLSRVLFALRLKKPPPPQV